jgi:hypothetical protein
LILENIIKIGDVGSSWRAGGTGRLAVGARASWSGGDSIWGGGEENDSLKEELHGGAWRVGRCASEGGLLVVSGMVGEVVEVHSIVEGLLSVTVGSERVQRTLAIAELLAAVEADEDGG